MQNASDNIRKIIENTVVKDPRKLQKQQDYYNKLSIKGIAKKQTYNLKPVSAI